ncbi:hypothetical protein BJV82DRAFT_672394 [Fennellomyces sp. T-0311]|nr:hypothetical protein BJV82DRAFT_672394 [Fennellomyces sp. T-0311]
MTYTTGTPRSTLSTLQITSMDEQQYNDLKHYLETLEIPRSYDAKRRKNIRQQSKRYFVNGDKLFRSGDPPKPVLTRDDAEEPLLCCISIARHALSPFYFSSIRSPHFRKRTNKKKRHIIIPIHKSLQPPYTDPMNSALLSNILAQDEELISDVFSTSSSSRSSTSPTTTDSDDDLTQYKENSSLIASSISTTLLYPSQPRQRSAGHPRPSLPWQHRRRHRKGTQDAPNNA